MLVGACTDIGKIREVNQDSYYCCNKNDMALFIVADGMGGHKAGEIASKMAIDSIKKSFEDNSVLVKNGQILPTELIIRSLKNANVMILEKSKTDESCDGMGTTITLAYIYNNKIHIGHIGDSRAYLCRNNKLTQLTEDHSLVAELVKNGTISKEEAKFHPQKNIITRALGTDEDVDVDIIIKDIDKDDIYLLCTDGLTNMVNDDLIKNIILSSNNVQHICERLVYTANEAGGIDNSTAIIIKIK